MEKNENLDKEGGNGIVIKIMIGIAYRVALLMLIAKVTHAFTIAL